MHNRGLICEFAAFMLFDTRMRDTTLDVRSDVRDVLENVNIGNVNQSLWNEMAYNWRYNPCKDNTPKLR